MKKTRCFGRNRLFAVVAVVTATSAAADSDDSWLSTFTLEEIVVTAQKRGEQKLIDIPISISSIDGARIEEIGSETITDMLSYAPGVSLIDDGIGQSRPQIRGLSGFFGDTLVAFYIDDLPFNSISSSVGVPDFGSFDLERIEVLKGPQGTLYGASALGGVVRILTKEPELDQFSGISGKVDLSWASIEKGGEYRQVATAINVPIVEGKAALRLVVDYQDEGGWVDAPAFPGGPEKDYNDTEQSSIRTKLKVQATDNLTLKATAWFRDFEADGRAASNEDRDNLKRVASEPLEDPFNMYNGVIEYEGEGYSFYNATSYIKFRDQVRTAVLPITLALPAPFPPVSGMVSSLGETEDETISNETRLNGSTNGGIEWLVGAFLRDQEAHTESSADWSDSLNAVGVPDTASMTERRSESWAVFGESMLPFLDKRLELTLGMRYYEDKRSLDGTSGSSGDTFNTFNPKLSLAYKFDNALLYTSLAKGFRAGYLNTQQAINDFLNDPFATDPLLLPELTDEETLWTLELGAKADFYSGKLSAEAAIYHNQWDDFLATVLTTTRTSNGVINAGEVKGTGIDFGLRYRLQENLVLMLSGNYNDTTMQDSIGNAIEKGNRPAYSPELSLASSVDYTWDVDNAGWTGMAHLDVQFTDEVETFTASGATVIATPSEEIVRVNGRVGFKWDYYEVTLFVKNLLDDDSLMQPPSSLTGLDTELRTRPRTIGLNLKWILD